MPRSITVCFFNENLPVWIDVLFCHGKEAKSVPEKAGLILERKMIKRPLRLPTIL